MEPPVSGIRGHHVSFDISLEDSEDFKAALRARGMGALIHAVSSNGTYSNFKSSVLAEGPLDLNSIPMASLEEKSKEVETFYATSPEIQPSDHESSKTKSTREHMSLADPDEAVPLPKMPLHKTATSPRYKDGCSELIRDHHSVDKGCDAATEKTVHLSVTHLPLSKLIVDTDELLTDVESLDFAETTPMPGPGETEPVFDVGKQNRRAPMPEKKALSKGRNGQRSDETNPVSAGNTIQALSGSSKRRRAVDDSTGEETRRRKLAKTQPVYNSQLLRPQETATTRSTTKYTARARKSSPLHSYSETDFDVIPSTSRAYIPLKSDPSPDVLVNITDVKSTTTPMGHEVVRAAASNKGLKPTEPSGKKGKGTNVGERSHVSNKAKRPRKRATIIDSEDGVEDLPLKTTTVLLDEPKNGTVWREGSTETNVC
ncbi:hypothetical protein JB92DRAFT_1760554 [Gautieria morchelliformis]|nr:hypothetical protein JB92DRAFT_1760554 [Gautieria morchelliformis]